MSLSRAGLAIGEHADVVAHEGTFDKGLNFSPDILVGLIWGEHAVKQKVRLFLSSHTRRLDQINVPVSNVELRARVVAGTHSGVDLHITAHVLTLVEFLVNSQLFEVLLLSSGQWSAHLIGQFDFNQVCLNVPDSLIVLYSVSGKNTKTQMLKIFESTFPLVVGVLGQSVDVSWDSLLVIWIFRLLSHGKSGIIIFRRSFVFLLWRFRVTSSETSKGAHHPVLLSVFWLVEVHASASEGVIVVRSTLFTFVGF